MAMMKMISDPMKINPDFPNKVFWKSFETMKEITMRCFKKLEFIVINTEYIGIMKVLLP